MDRLDFIALCNRERKANKSKWVFLSEVVEGITISYKAYDTWVQVLIIDNVKHSSHMDISVKQFNEFLNNALCINNSYI